MREYLYKASYILDKIDNEDPVELKVGFVNLAIDIMKWGAAQEFGLNVSTGKGNEENV